MANAVAEKMNAVCLQPRYIESREDTGDEVGVRPGGVFCEMLGGRVPPVH